MPIDFACPKCAKKYRVKDELAGKTAKCTQCTERISIPPTAIRGAQAAAAPKASTPQKPVATASVKPPAPAKKADELSSWFDAELMTAPASAAAPALKAAAGRTASPAAPKRSALCPSCRVPLAPNAVLCVACGYDTRKAQKLTTKKGDDADDAPAKKSSALASGASFGRGVLCSAIGALIGAGVWAGIAIALRVEVGYVAIGLGALAGLGMAFGHEDKDGTLAGITAAAISIVGILAAKFFVFQYLKDMVEDAGVSLEALEAATGESLSFGSLFSPIDGLFILLSVGAAYRLGSGQATD
jgi:hypothetical protein